MKENSQKVPKSSTLSLASAVLATVSTICLIVVAFCTLSSQYSLGLQMAQEIIIAASISFFSTQLLALTLGVFALRRAFSVRGSTPDKSTSLFSVVSSLIYLSIAVFFLLQIIS